VICAVRERWQSPEEFPVEVNPWPLRRHVANVEIDMVNFGLAEPAKHDFAHRSRTGSDDAFAIPEVITQLAPGGFEPLARCVEICSELCCRVAGTRLDVLRSLVPGRVLTADLADCCAFEQPDVAVGVTRQVADDMTARPTRQQTHTANFFVVQRIDRRKQPAVRRHTGVDEVVRAHPTRLRRHSSAGSLVGGRERNRTALASPRSHESRQEYFS
jgi:hypothetical protein